MSNLLAVQPKSRKPEFLSALRYDDLSTFAKPIWLKVECLNPRGFGMYSRILRHEIWIPNGFFSDGRSSPRPVWGIVPPVGPALWAALPHDWLYKRGGYDLLVGETTIFIPVTRMQADAVYREMMILKGFTKKQSWWSWSALRVGGGPTWDEHRRRD